MTLLSRSIRPQESQKSPRNFWSFKTPVAAPIPVAKSGDQVRTPIDAFVLRRLEEKGWKLSPDTDRATLIRRAYLDLVGLPPTPDEIRAFVGDSSPRSYEQLIDRLLDSPHYGERWGRHWLDVAGYSDSVGNAADELRPNSWEYRDWVIRALNEDKPYDQFLTEQLAGDQLVNYESGTRPKPEQIDALIATGFLRVPPDITDTQSIYQVDKWYDALQTTVETSAKALMGLTVGCARCHDHKFDPILQEDYYRLTAIYQAVWDPENWLPAAIGFGEWPTRYILDADKPSRDAWIEAVTDSERYRALRDDRRALAAAYLEYRTRRSNEVTAEIAAGGREATAEAAAEISDEQLEELYPELAKQAAAVRAKAKVLDDLMPRRIWSAWDLSKKPSPTYLLLRGNYLTPGPEVEPGVLAVLDDPEDRFRFPEPEPEWNHTGRRLTLARWLTQPDHPLTARLIVNRVWLYHFGEGIVRTPDDFGEMGGTADSSRVARLARGELCEERLEPQVAASSNHEFIGLSTVLGGRSGEICRGPIQQAVLAQDSSTARGRGDSGLDSDHQWTARANHVWKVRTAHPRVGRRVGRRFGERRQASSQPLSAEPSQRIPWVASSFRRSADGQQQYAAEIPCRLARTVAGPDEQPVHSGYGRSLC